MYIGSHSKFTTIIMIQVFLERKHTAKIKRFQNAKEAIVIKPT